MAQLFAYMGSAYSVVDRLGGGVHGEAVKEGYM